MDCKLLLGLFGFTILTYVVELGHRNIAINKTVTPSSRFPHPIWNNFEKIVDGNTDQSGELCKCCAATTNSNNPWITVDLENEYWIDVITLFGRTEYTLEHQNYLGLELYFTQASQISENSTVAYKVEGSGHINFVNISFEEQFHARYLTFYMPRDSWILSMCEVEVYGTDCKYGFYGPKCNHTCGQCQNEEPCDDVSGDCMKCQAGYIGSKCLTACSPGTYGDDCQFLCGFCYDDKLCDFRTGTCEECKAGYTSSTCNLVCSPGSFGSDCKSTCGRCHGSLPCDRATGECDKCEAGYHGTKCLSACYDGFYGSNCPGVCGHCYDGLPCDKIDGTCDVCSPGYQGRLCDTECKPGTYGQNCSEECGICRQYTSCDHVTGICVNGCAAGRRGSLCKHDCEINTFGKNCSLTCHCQQGIACNPFSGSCENGVCADGYTGLGCQQTTFEDQHTEDCEKQQKEDVIPLPIFIGVIAVLICVIVGLVLVVLLPKCRNKQTDDTRETTNKAESGPYGDLQLTNTDNSVYTNIA